MNEVRITHGPFDGSEGRVLAQLFGGRFVVKIAGHVYVYPLPSEVEAVEEEEESPVAG